MVAYNNNPKKRSPGGAPRVGDVANSPGARMYVGQKLQVIEPNFKRKFAVSPNYNPYQQPQPQHQPTANVHPVEGRSRASTFRIGNLNFAAGQSHSSGSGSGPKQWPAIGQNMPPGYNPGYQPENWETMPSHGMGGPNGPPPPRG